MLDPLHSAVNLYGHYIKTYLSIQNTLMFMKRIFKNAFLIYTMSKMFQKLLMKMYNTIVMSNAKHKSFLSFLANGTQTNMDGISTIKPFTTPKEKYCVCQASLHRIAKGFMLILMFIILMIKP